MFCSFLSIVAEKYRADGWHSILTENLRLSLECARQLDELSDIVAFSLELMQKRALLYAWINVIVFATVNFHDVSKAHQGCNPLKNVRRAPHVRESTTLCINTHTSKWRADRHRGLLARAHVETCASFPVCFRLCFALCFPFLCANFLDMSDAHEGCNWSNMSNVNHIQSGLSIQFAAMLISRNDELSKFCVFSLDRV